VKIIILKPAVLSSKLVVVVTMVIIGLAVKLGKVITMVNENISISLYTKNVSP
jgi:hypothetical protein